MICLALPTGSVAISWLVDSLHSTIDVFEITNPLAPVRILGGDIIPDDSLYQINFEQDFSGEHSYLVLSPSGWLIPWLLPRIFLLT